MQAVMSHFSQLSNHAHWLSMGTSPTTSHYLRSFFKEQQRTSDAKADRKIPGLITSKTGWITASLPSYTQLKIDSYGDL